MIELPNQVVMVTGSTGNLGHAVVRTFQSAGAHIVAIDRSTGPSAGLFSELLGSPDHLVREGIDVTDPRQMQHLAGEVVDRFGRIDVLVNTVGGYRAGTPLHETTLETWDFLLNLNARSVFVTSQAVIPAMLKQGRGKIINIGSHSGIAAQGKDAGYSAAKSAVARLTESMAADYKQQGIQVNAVLPSALVSPADYQADPTRGVTPDAVAQVILFLASPMADIITGALIPAYGMRF